MSQELGTLVLELRAEVAGFKKSLADAKGSVEQFHGDMRRATMESRGAIVLLGEEIGVRLPRHLVTFLNTLPGVSTAMAAAFSGVAVAGLGLILIETGKKAYEFFERTGKAGENIQKGFDGLHEGAQKANDALAVTNDRLEIQIAKLEGRHTNALKLALDEARLSADDLADAMEAALKRASELLDKNKVGLLGAMLHGSMTTGSDKDLVGGVLAQVDKVLRENERRLHAAGPDDDVTALQAHNNAAAQEKLAWALGKVNTELGKRQSHILEGGAWEPRDLSANVAILQGAKDFLLGQQASLNESLRHGDDEAKRDRLTAAKEAGEAAKKAAHEQLQGFEDQLAAMKGFETLSVAQEAEYWASLLGAAAKFPENYRAVMLKIYSDTAEILKQTQAEWTKFFDDNNRLAADAERKFAEEQQKGLDRFGHGVEERARPYAQRNVAIGQEVSNRLGAGTRISDLEEEQRIINGIEVTEENRLAITGSLRDLQHEIAAIYSQQLLAGGTALDGMRAFFNDMVNQARTAGQQIYETMREAVDGINRELARAITGQKTNWASMFQGLGEHIATQGLQTLESKGAGLLQGIPGIGPLLGNLLPGSASKPDGTAGNPLNVKVVGGTGGGGIGDLFGSSGGGSTGGGGESLGIPGGLMGLFGIGGFAEGGDVFPGTPAMVGERGPELFMPSSRGTILPHESMARMGGSFYNVNVAAGVSRDEFETTLQRALVQVHGQSVKASYALSQEMARRVPRG